MYRIKIKKVALKQLEKLPLEIIERINIKILTLSENPRPKGCKKLHSKEELYRVKISSYRIVYSIHDNILVIEVIKIGHRKNIYRTN
jgi:mRNA interferase RelE/StbE